MKTQRIKTVTVLAIALLMFAGTNLYAQRGRNYSNQGKGFGQNQSCMMLPDLTEEQQNKIEALRIAHLKEMTAFRNQMNELRAKKQTLQTTDNADLKEINSVIDKMTEVHNKMMKTSAQHRQEVRSQLTDEQKVYFDSRPMRGHRNGRGSGRGAGNGRGCSQGNGQGNGQGYGQAAGYGRGYGRGLNPYCPYNTVND
jgi:Spy/CpxP family protein refolding chaperone